MKNAQIRSHFVIAEDVQNVMNVIIATTGWTALAVHAETDTLCTKMLVIAQEMRLVLCMSITTWTCL